MVKTPSSSLAAFALIISAALFCLQAAYATERYVSTSGHDDTGNGTIDAPWRTIAKGLQNTAAGDTLYLRGAPTVSGIYTDPAIYDNIPSGTSDTFRTTVARYQSETVRLNVPSGSANGLTLGHAGAIFQYITIDGLVIDATNANQAGESHHGIVLYPSCSYIRVQNCTIINAPNSGVDTRLGSHHNELLNLDISNAGGSGSGHGIYLESHDSVIKGCWVHDNNRGGIQIWHGGADNNTVWRNRVYNSGISGTGNGNGIALGANSGEAHINNNAVYDNVVWGNRVDGIKAFNRCDNALIYNNTVYGNGENGINMDSSTLTNGTRVINNIAWGNDTNPLSPVGKDIRDNGLNTFLSNNLFVTFSGFTPGPTDKVNVNPQFVSSTPTVVDDFKIQSTSPAKDAGTNSVNPPVTMDYWGETRISQGMAYDIGADEIQSSSGLVAHWKLDETTGLNANDETTNNNDGTLSGGPTWVAPAKIGNGLNFDGGSTADDKVDCGNGASLNQLGAITVCAWVKANSMGENGAARILSKGTGLDPTGTAGGWRLVVGGSGQVRFSVDYSTTDLFRPSVDGVVPASGTTWCFLAATWDGSATATQVKLYKDGSQVSYGTPTNGAPTNGRGDDTSAHVWLGNDSTGARTFDGVLDDVRIYNRVLDASEVLAIYNEGASDTTPPTVSVTAPIDGTNIRGTVAVSANAADNVGVAGVQFKLDGVDLQVEDTTPPYSISWDTATASNASHTLTAVARDAAGNTTTSSGVTVTVDNSAPTGVAVTAPVAGANVRTTIAVSADASDNVGVAGVQFKLDGANLQAESTTPPYSISWDTTTASNASHTLTAVARDAAGNTTTSSGVTVTVDNSAPTGVAVTDPANGATVSGSAVPVSGTASDNVGVVGMQFKLDGANLQAEDIAPPYSINWDTTVATEGVHTLTAVARDTAGNTTTSATVSVTVNNLIPPVPSGLAATKAGSLYNQINLSWTDGGATETDYSIERKKGSGGTYNVIYTTAANVTAYNDVDETNGPGSGTTYYYRIQAHNSFGYSGYSLEASATTDEVTSRQAHWKLDSTTGTIANDEISTNNNGVLTGFTPPTPPSWTGGRINNGLNFDGGSTADDIVDCQSGTSLDNLAAITVSVWIKANSLGEGGGGRIVSKGTGLTPSAGWRLVLGGTNQVRFSVDYGTDLFRPSADNVVPIGTGAWCHLIATWDGSTTATNVKLYKDGSEVSYSTAWVNAVLPRGDDRNDKVYLGNDSTRARTFDGVLDDVRIYNRVLNANEIRAVWRAGLD